MLNSLVTKALVFCGVAGFFVALNVLPRMLVEREENRAIHAAVDQAAKDVARDVAREALNKTGVEAARNTLHKLTAGSTTQPAQ